ncbi:MAG: hypothetical protein H5T86_04525 [Armatimonadetes bacterium]|nr:hypothetical protein [Armatimonadota bacterium]
MRQPKQTGEPYVLAGKRLVFTNWLYIRPGAFAWVNAKGENVSVTGSEGPWDAHFVRYDWPHGIRLVAQPAQRVGPIIKSERRWEAIGIQAGTLIKDGSKYRLWARCASEGRSDPCYFESEDGINWRRPALGLVKLDEEETNILDFGVGTVFIDPVAPPEERYKCVELTTMSYEDFEEYKKRRPDGWEPRAKREDVQGVFYIYGGVSPDGIHWKRLPEPLVVEHSDTQIVAYYDERLGTYVMYTRNWYIGEKWEGAPEEWGRVWHWLGRRAIGRTESEDFRRFPVSQVILAPPLSMPPSDVLYTNCKTTVPGAPDHHLMFPHCVAYGG